MCVCSVVVNVRVNMACKYGVVVIIFLFVFDFKVGFK